MGESREMASGAGACQRRGGGRVGFWCWRERDDQGDRLVQRLADSLGREQVCFVALPVGESFVAAGPALARTAIGP